MSGATAPWVGEYYARGPPAEPTMATTVSAVQSTWKVAASLGADTVGVLLFKHIFRIAPQALALFSFKDEPDLYNSAALKKHGAKVVTTVGAAVSGLDDIPALVPVLQSLGARHVGYGVLAPHYDVVGEALIATLRQGLGDEAFTPEVEAAWTAVYGIVASTMKGSHYQ